MATDIQPEKEVFSHQFATRFKKGNHSEEFENRLAEFMIAFVQCYPHYIVRKEVGSDQEDWIFKFWIEKV